LQCSYKELSQGKEEIEAERNGLQTEVETLQTTIGRQERETESLQRKAADNEKLLAKHALEEKAVYEQSIADLRTQLSANRAQLAKLISLQNEAETNAKTAHSEAAKYEKEARRAGSEVRALRAQIDRDHRVAAAALQATKTTAEADYYTRLEEQRSKSDAEKRAVLTIGVEAFRGLFNPSDSLNERTFKTVITKASEELTRLTRVDRTIRQMLKVRDQQTTEDAVAHALLRDQISE
jgi:chromosome segregation ATPase